MSQNNKNALNVLVSRPSHQSACFVEKLQHAGFNTLELPTIEICFTPADLTDTLQSDLIIFTSANAVTGADKSLPLPWDSQATIAAIGSATAQSLKHLNCSVDVLPQTSSSTEALLDVIGNVTNLTVTIIRGDSGRETLYNALAERGARPIYQSVYQRKLPEYSQTRIQTLFNDGMPDIITVTSDLGLTNLLSIIPPALSPSLFSRPLVVNSKRCAQLAADKGFSAEIRIADPPGDESQLKEVLALSQSHMP